MKIKYEFADGTVSEVEVSAEIGSVIIESRKAEETADRRQRYNCPYSIEAVSYEGAEYADKNDFVLDLVNVEDNKKIHEAFSHLSDTQRRRLLMVAEGLTLREIARREGVEIKTVRESVDGARKKFLKFY